MPNLPHRRRIDKVTKIASFDGNGLPGDVSEEQARAISKLAWSAPVSRRRARPSDRAPAWDELETPHARSG